ncbi:uncharacterized protein LOC107418612 isoform X1 [Ziziphus jujuba]|uniref:Uncharacterized protein LOC107418612 isoform X1 n=1 Tax=Ziziphus jujuba TaxID=326968 RepID=A0A6P3ZSI7_ZIZJJ|nr:uncharacterized protein LOC107418612 isoform X1 [Ziziphus jujuba]
MLGTGLQFGTVRGEESIYIPVKARKNYNQQKQGRKPKSEKNENPDTNSKMVASDNRSPKEASNSSKKQLLEPSITPTGNLDRLLESTTPLVPAQYFSKTTMRGWRTCDVEFQPYFTLNDLWESFKEWSAYGAGVPLVLDKSDSVVQYYVPYLSGIQLYGESSVRSDSKSRQASEDSDGDYYRDSSSDGSSDYEVGKIMKISMEQQHLHHLTSEAPFRMGRLSIHDENSALQEGFSSDEGDARNSRGVLLFEYLERDPPYSREPLADKISDLACRYPGLKTLRSCDLLPASWFSVAWYPIYRIPMGPTLKDLDACFLTYHSLSTPVAGSGSGQAPVVVYPSEMDGVPKLSLSVFGMASYKFKGSVWIQNGISECQLANSLMQAADNWLRLLQVKQPDFQFFASHGMYCR